MSFHIAQESAENYLETIYSLSEKMDKIRAIDVANSLEISRASVSRALTSLKEKGFLEDNLDSNLILTPQGIEVAKNVIRRHKILVSFLVKVAKVSDVVADTDACRLEHVITDKTIDAIKAFLKDFKSEDLDDEDIGFISSHLPQQNTDLQESGENYLETIYLLSHYGDLRIRAIEVAKYLNLSRASVSRALSNLKEKEFVESDDAFITLTDKGLARAGKIYMRHVDLTKFLIKVLHVDFETAEKDACRMEHMISEQTIFGLRNYLLRISNSSDLSVKSFD